MSLRTERDRDQERRRFLASSMTESRVIRVRTRLQVLELAVERGIREGWTSEALALLREERGRLREELAQRPREREDRQDD